MVCQFVIKQSTIMDVCTICFEENAPRSCNTCTMHMHAKCQRKLFIKNSLWKRQCIICKTERSYSSSTIRVTRSMTQKYQSNTIIELISRFELTEDIHEKQEILEEIFNNFYRFPILMRLPGIRSMVQDRLISLYAHWPRASHYFRLILGKELKT